MAKHTPFREHYDTEIGRIDSGLSQSVQDQSTAVKHIRQAQIQELQELLRRSTNIEKDIFKTTTELREVYDNARAIFEVVLDGRIQDCEGSLTQLKEITEKKQKEQLEQSQEL